MWPRGQPTSSHLDSHEQGRPASTYWNQEMTRLAESKKSQGLEWTSMRLFFSSHGSHLALDMYKEQNRPVAKRMTALTWVVRLCIEMFGVKASDTVLSLTLPGAPPHSCSRQASKPAAHPHVTTQKSARGKSAWHTWWERMSQGPRAPWWTCRLYHWLSGPLPPMTLSMVFSSSQLPTARCQKK